MNPNIKKSLYASLDLTGANRPWDLTWLTDDACVHHRKFGKKSKIEDFFDWVAEYRPSVMAVDAPSGFNRKRTLDPVVRESRTWNDKTYRNMRLCEADLRSRNIKLYYTPDNDEDAKDWIKVGWKVYERLKSDLKYSLWNKPGQVRIRQLPTVIEVHPHACIVVGLGWIPQLKTCLAGQLERTAYLLEAGRAGGKAWEGNCLPRTSLLRDVMRAMSKMTWDTIRAGGLSRIGMSHDLLDSLAGLATVVRAAEGHAFAVGDQSEGVIVLPGSPEASYRTPRRGTQ
jgi:hypothetical protein